MTVSATRYFPPAGGQWASVEPAAAGWSPSAVDAALRYAEGHSSTGIVVVSGGRIMAERYWSAPEVLPVGMRGGALDGGRVTEDVASMQKRGLLLDPWVRISG